MFDATEATAREEKRLRQIGREARREARRRERERRREELATTPSARLKTRFLRVTLATAVAMLCVLTLLPPFLIPVSGVTSSRFFIRNAPDSRRLFAFEHHTGLDIAAPIGTRVGASRSGRVMATGTDPAYGLYVDLRHLFGWVTRYAHLSEISIREGQLVLRGAKLGEVGMSGRATGPHLHFEVRIAGRSYPPGAVLVFHRLRQIVFRRP